MYLEHDGEELLNVSLEIVGKARELSDTLRTELTGVLLGSGIEHLTRISTEFGANKVLVVDSPILDHYSTYAHTKAMAELVRARKPEILLIGATHDGRDLAGRLAVRLKTGLTADVMRLEIDESGLLVAGVPGFGGGILAMVKCEASRPQMSTVRPGVFAPLEPDRSRMGTVETVEVDVSEQDVKREILERVVEERVDITRAEHLVVGGLGTGGDLTLIRNLAQLMGGEVGVTRPLADEGYVSRDHQIGTTGYSVRPKVLIVAGASGAMTFTSGIDDSEVIVAINTDREAPIFDHADYCVVDDLFKVLPPLIKEVRGSRE